MTEQTTYFDITMNSTEKTESDSFITSLQHPDVSGFLYVVLEVSIIGFIGFILYYFSSKEKRKNASDPERPVLLEGSPEEESAQGRVDRGRTEKGMFSSTPQFLISNYSREEEIEHCTPSNSKINPSLLVTPCYRRADLLSPDTFISAGSHIQASSRRDALQSERSPAYTLCPEMITPGCGRSYQLSPDPEMLTPGCGGSYQLSPDPEMLTPNCGGSYQLSPDAFMSAASHIPMTQSEKSSSSSLNQDMAESVKLTVITTCQDVSLSERDQSASVTSSPYVSVLSVPADVSNVFSDN